MFSDFARARWMGRNGRKAVQERFTWDTITEQMLTIYQGLCPSRAMLPHRAVDKVQAVLVDSSREASWAGAMEENMLAGIGEEGARGACISVQATRRIRAVNPAGQTDDAVTAIKRCNQHRRRFCVHHKQPPGIKRTAVPWEASEDDLVPAAPKEVLMAQA